MKQNYQHLTFDSHDNQNRSAYLKVDSVTRLTRRFATDLKELVVKWSKIYAKMLVRIAIIIVITRSNTTLRI